MNKTNPTEGEQTAGSNASEGQINVPSVFSVPEGEKELRERWKEAHYKWVASNTDERDMEDAAFDFFLSEFKALEARKEGEYKAQRVIDMNKETDYWEETKVPIIVKAELTTFKNSVRELIEKKISAKPSILSEENVDYMYSLAQFNKVAGSNGVLQDLLSSPLLQ